MEEKKEKNGILFNLLLITIFWNIWFPKAGIKLGGIPLTVGNVFFAITFALWVFIKLRSKTVRVQVIVSSITILGIFYFIIKYTIVYGTIGGIGTSIGYIIPLCIYPLIFFVTYDFINSKEQIEKIMKVIVYGFFFLCIYAIIQSIVGIENCDIPGLTVNLTDYRQWGDFWYRTKANGTNAENIKIVGTYQNGNLFGISLILIYPLVYGYYKKYKKNKILIISLILFIITVFLTLSRACWLGIVLFITFGVVFERESTKQSLLRKVITIIISIIAIIYVFKYLPTVANRLFDTDKEDWVSMSGRTAGAINVFKSLQNSNSILPYIIGPYGIAEYYGLAYEVMPLSVFVQTGIIGLILLYSVFFKTLGLLKNKNYIAKSVRLAIIIWLIVGFIECGYWLPPAALNIFMIMALGLKSNEILKGEEI